MLFFVIFFSPPVEWVDDDRQSTTGSFWDFTLDIWWPPAPGPTWFLGVLLLFSFGYALVRVVRPAAGRKEVLSWKPLILAGLVIAVASFVVRLAVPLGEEVFRLALGQSPGWVLGFVLGCLGGERGWFDAIPPKLARGCRLLGWGAAVAIVGLIAASVATGGGPEDFGGGANWPALLLVSVEAALVIGMSIWLIDLFRRRFDQQGSAAEGDEPRRIRSLPCPPGGAGRCRVGHPRGGLGARAGVPPRLHVGDRWVVCLGIVGGAHPWCLAIRLSG